MYVNHEEVKDYSNIQQLRIRVPRILDDEEVMNAAGCVGYAVKQHSGENATGDPYEISRRSGNTYFNVDIYRDMEDYSHFFYDVEDYLREGSPKRTTNRSGSGTKGTRLVKGTGEECEVMVWIPDTVPRVIEVSVDGKVVHRVFHTTHRGYENESLAIALEDYANALRRGV